MPSHAPTPTARSRPKHPHRRPRWFGRTHADRSLAFRVTLFVSGLLLILAGALLGLVPLLPGFPLGILGIVLLSASSRRIQRLLKRLIRRLPQRVRRRLGPIGQAHDRP